MDELAAKRLQRAKAETDAFKLVLDQWTGAALQTAEQAHREWRLERMREDSPPAT